MHPRLLFFPIAMRIRPYAPSDENAVVDLWKRCGLTRPWNDPRKDIARKMTVQPEWFLVGEAERVIVATAMAGYDGHRGNVYYVAVSPDFQGRGYGRAIMAEVERQLTAAGCPKINLMVRSGNDPVIDFYRRLGYTIDEVSCLGKRLIPDE